MAGAGMWTGLTPESSIQESKLASVFYLRRVMFLISVNPVLSFFLFFILQMETWSKVLRSGNER